MSLRYVIFGAFLMASCLSTDLCGQEFRVETEVFIDDQKLPVSESLTIFTVSRIYDFLLKEPEEITVFDVQNGRVVLLDTANKLRTELTTSDLLELCNAMRTRAADEGDVSLFTSDFAKSFNEELNVLTLTSERMIYTAKAIPAKHPEGAKQFQQFADWYARLNAVRPGNLPPFGRIELNKALAERNLVPEDIERTITITRPLSTTKLRARGHHVFTWLISNTDRSRIERAGEHMSKFKQVSLKEYWNVERIASSKK